MANSKYITEVNSLAHDDEMIAAKAALIPNCQNYSPGHVMHFIQFKHAQNTGYTSAQIIRVDGKFITLVVDDPNSDEGSKVTRTWWNHDPYKLQVIADIATLESDAEVLWCNEYHVLMVRLTTIGFAINLCAKEGGDCRPK